MQPFICSLSYLWLHSKMLCFRVNRLFVLVLICNWKIISADPTRLKSKMLKCVFNMLNFSVIKIVRLYPCYLFWNQNSIFFKLRFNYYINWFISYCGTDFQPCLICWQFCCRNNFFTSKCNSITRTSLANWPMTDGIVKFKNFWVCHNVNCWACWHWRWPPF